MDERADSPTDPDDSMHRWIRRCNVMPIPTPEQLELINRRLWSVTEENCFVFET